MVFVEEQSYTGTGTVTAPQMVHVNHGLGEIFTALRDAGLTVTALEEHREVPWNPRGDAMVPSPDFEGELTREGPRPNATDLHPAGLSGLPYVDVVRRVFL